MYLNKFTGKPVKVFASSYLLNIVFPSVSRSIPYKLRKLLRDFFLNYIPLQHYGLGEDYSSMADELRVRYSRGVFLPRDISADLSYPWHECARNCLLAYEEIKDTFFDFKLDFDLIKDLARKRDLFLSKVFQGKEDVDLSAKAYVIKKRFERATALEQM